MVHEERIEPHLPSTRARAAARQRGDEAVIVYTTMPVASPSFRAQAEALAAQWHPAKNMDTEDTAVHFLTSLQAARQQDWKQAVLTYCLYEDGTPAQWQSGATRISW